MKPLFEPLHNCQLQFLACKVAFHIAITSLQRVSEIHALTIKEPYFQVFSDKVRLCTNLKFLFKVIFPFHLYQALKLLVFFPKPNTIAEHALHTLDVKRALMYYVECSKPFRKTKQLFFQIQPKETLNPKQI